MIMVKNALTSYGPRDPLWSDRALFEAATSIEGLYAGWQSVRRNNGASGGDNITTDMFARDASGWIARLRRSLLSWEYRPGRLRYVDIPKRSGGVRTLAIPTVPDRVVQSAVAKILSPKFELEFEADSFAYRPGRSVAQAVARVTLAQREGFDWIVDADIENFFGSVRHDSLMERWHESITDGPLTHLVGMWLNYAAPEGIGLAQGSPLSPLLANLFLDRLDEHFGKNPAYRFVRFADDFVILAKSQSSAHKAKSEMQYWLSDAGLQVNERKTRILNFDQGLRFLGHLFVRSLVTKSVNDDRGQDGDILSFMRQIARTDAESQKDQIAEQERDEQQRKAGYSPGFRILYINQAGRRLHFRNQGFTVQNRLDPIETGGSDKWQEIISIHHSRIDRIDIGPKAGISAAARDLALATDTPIAYVDGHGQTKGWTAMELAPRAGRHMKQAACAIDPVRRVELAALIVEGRVRSQRAVLRRLMRGREDLTAVVEALHVINTVLGWRDQSRLLHAQTVPELLGYEGQATAAWWRAISALMPPAFRFAKRTRQGETDSAANAALNMLTWLLHRDVCIAVKRAGLHPGFGVLHTAQDYNDACVYDIMEGLRAHLVGGLAVYCVNKRIVKHTDFVIRHSGVDIKTPAQNALIRAYEKRVARRVKCPKTGKQINWRQLMLQQAYNLAAHVDGEAAFEPYEMGY